jgi:K(+)-stimulated pyrophosphate-energized sodium pump
VFETGGATLASKSKAQLDRIAKIVSAYDGMTFELQGYTDNTGNADANVALSQKRAESVMQYLVTKNISVGKMVAKGYGAENPRASNNTSEGRAQNRRTEIRAVKN